MMPAVRFHPRAPHRRTQAHEPRTIHARSTSELANPGIAGRNMSTAPNCGVLDRKISITSQFGLPKRRASPPRPVQPQTRHAWQGRPIALLAVSAALCALIAHEVFDWRERMATDIPTMPLPDPLRSPASDPPDRHDAAFTEVQARPLFAPDRRQTDEGMPGLPRLTGIIIAEPQRLAIFAAAPGRSIIVMRAGGQLGDYEVESITEFGVTVVGPRGRMLLKPIFESTRPIVLLTAPPRIAPSRLMSRRGRKRIQRYETRFSTDLGTTQ